MRTMNTFIAFLAFAANPSPAPSTCEALRTQYEIDLKNAVWFDAVHVTKSKKQAIVNLSNDRAAVTNWLLFAQINLTLMQQHQCPLPDEPADPEKYSKEALLCWIALTDKARKIDSPTPKECKIEDWNGHSADLIDVPYSEPPVP